MTARLAVLAMLSAVTLVCTGVHSDRICVRFVRWSSVPPWPMSPAPTHGTTPVRALPTCPGDMGGRGHYHDTPLATICGRDSLA